MRKIRLSDTDIEFFDLEVSPAEFLFFQKHKDAFRCMWKEQGKPFWTKFTITFRSFTVKHGVIKHMSCDTPKFENLLDQAFIYIHEQFVDGKEAMARGFIDECARLAQNHDKFPHLDSKSFTKDPFYSRDTRDLFRRFFGSPDQKSSYVKVYVLSPIYLRFGGSVCRCLKKWMDAPSQDCKDDSYWIPPSPQHQIEEESTTKAPVLMCTNCLDDCGTRYFKERICGQQNGPKFLDYWKLGDPRFNDPDNPLYNKKADRDSDWRDRLSPEDFRDFTHFAKFKYGTEEEKCKDCLSLVDKDDGYVTNVNQKKDNDKKKKKKKKKKDKEEIAKEKRKDEVEEEVQRIIDHITGKKTQQDMPPVLRVRTDTAIIQADPSDSQADTNSGSPDKKNSPGPAFHNIAKNKKILFGSNAKRSDDIKFGILGNDDFSKGNVVGGFRVFKLEDERSGAKEITISVNAVNGFPDGDTKDAAKMEASDGSGNTNRLSVELIKSKIENLPDKMEWWEGVGWCACVINYEVEEKDVCPNNYTNFTIKITGRKEMAIKRVMFKLLIYVSNRKKRLSPGWTMDDDDVVASVLPEEIPEEECIVITLQQGFRFEERLSDEERKTMSRGRSSVFRNDNNGEGPMCFYVQPKGMKDKEQVLMALDGGVANAVAKGDQGPMNFKKLLTRISGHCIDDKVGYGTPNYPQKTKSKDPSFCDLPDPYDFEINKTPMWDQILLSPRTFELLFMVNKDREQELKGLGLRRVDPENVPGKGREKQPPLQTYCKTCRKEVFDCPCIDKTRFSKPIPCNCSFCNKKSNESKDKSSPKATPTMDTPTKETPTVTKTTPTKDTPKVTKTTPTPAKDTPTQRKTKPTPTKATSTSAKKSHTSEVVGEFTITDVKHDKYARPDPVTTEELEHGFDLVEQQLKESRQEKAKDAKRKEEVKKKEAEGNKKETKKTSLGKRASDSAVPPKSATPKAHQFSSVPTRLEVPLHQILKGNMEGVFKFTAVHNQSTGPATANPLNFIVENVTPPYPGDADPGNGKKKEDTPKMTEEEKIAKRKQIEDNIAEVRRKEKAEELKKQQKLAEIRKQERKVAESKKFPKIEGMEEPNDLLTNFKFKPKEEFAEDHVKVTNSEVKDTDTADNPVDRLIKATMKECEEKCAEKLREMDEIGKQLFRDRLESQVGAEDAKAMLNLRRCTNCQKMEPSPKIYKKCLKCKEKKVKNARYYCGRDCQANDWTRRHKREHKDNLLN
ncbi:uncharacterized protein LOC110454914 [Mizuhopecten yessoensis]|uniref:uncharacterized protein LOC110454914 n=1 Tax=Mizuhopecten yessoensis TaxID=6573 RepID=UPI000B45DAC8|nr:uncharacterized protein LOC110454914 [Mizuhopecten yessoensis]